MKRPTADQIVAAACFVCEVNRIDLSTRSYIEAGVAKRLAILLMRKHTHLSHPDIMTVFGGKRGSHATSITAEQQANYHPLMYGLLMREAEKHLGLNQPRRRTRKKAQPSGSPASS